MTTNVTTNTPYIRILQGHDRHGAIFDPPGSGGPPGRDSTNGRDGMKGKKEEQGPKNGGVVFIRWAKFSCLNTTGT